jgi:N-formylglutamate deformylase
MSLVDLTYPSVGACPVLVEVPHAGTIVPEPLASMLDAGGGDVRHDADLYVERLFARAPSAGATLLCARMARYVVDLNRAETEIDDALFDAQNVRKRGAPVGAVWRCTGDGRPLLACPISRGHVEERLATYHAPYHRLVGAELARLRAGARHVLLLAGHSMPSRGKRLGRDEVRPDVVPGSVGRSTAHPALIDAVEEHFRAAGLSVRHDDPYRGGYSTQHYGAPAVGQHAIQIELNRALYMDERTLLPHPSHMARLTQLLESLVVRLGQVCAQL